MSQATNFSVPTIGPVSPLVMAQRIDDNFKAALSGHSGPGRPAYVTAAGTVWISTATAGKLKWMAFDGADDRVIRTLDLASGKVTHGDGVNEDIFFGATPDKFVAAQFGLKTDAVQAYFDTSALSADRVIRVPDKNGAIGAWEVLDIASPFAVTSWAKTNLGAFRELRITFDVEPDSVASGFGIQVSTDNGSTWQITNYHQQYMSASGAANAAGQVNLPSFSTSFGNSVLAGFGSAGHQGEFIISQFNKSRWLRVIGTAGYQITSTGALVIVSVMGGSSLSTARNAIRLTTGNAFSGRIVLEGIRG